MGHHTQDTERSSGVLSNGRKIENLKVYPCAELTKLENDLTAKINGISYDEELNALTSRLDDMSDEMAEKYSEITQTSDKIQSIVDEINRIDGVVTEQRSSIEQTASSITSRVNAIVGGMTQQESEIRQTAEEISLRVTSAEAQSLIEQFANSITLSVQEESGRASISLNGDGISLEGNTITISTGEGGDMTAEEIIDAITNPDSSVSTDVNQGLYLLNGQLYINANYLRSLTVTTDDLKLYGLLSIYNSATGTTPAAYIGYGQGQTESGATTRGAMLMSSNTSNYVIVTTAGARMTAGGHQIYVTSGGAGTDGNYSVGGNLYIGGNLVADHITGIASGGTAEVTIGVTGSSVSSGGSWRAREYASGDVDLWMYFTLTVDSTYGSWVSTLMSGSQLYFTAQLYVTLPGGLSLSGCTITTGADAGCFVSADRYSATKLRFFIMRYAAFNNTAVTVHFHVHGTAS